MSHNTQAELIAKYAPLRADKNALYGGKRISSVILGVEMRRTIGYIFGDPSICAGIWGPRVERIET
jgi:hypothetical protein